MMAEAERRHDGERVGKEKLLQGRIAVGKAVHAAKQNVAANFDALNDMAEHFGLCAAVFQVYQNRIMRSYTHIE